MTKGFYIAAVVAVIAWLFSPAASQHIEGPHQVTMAAKPMYTMDYIEGNMPFSFISDFMMRVAALHGIDESAPLWDIEFTLENRSGEAMEGFVAMEYSLFDPDNGFFFGEIGLPNVNLFNFCSHRHDFETSGIESRVQFQDWAFDGVDGPLADHSPVYLNFNSTHPVHETGVWGNIIHLCVTKGPKVQHMHDGWSWWHRHHHPSVHMHGHQTAANPLGLLAGDRLMALPTLFGVGCVYFTIFIVWCSLMVKHRANLISSVHWMLLLGIVLMMVRIAWDYATMWTLNAHGFQRPSWRMMIFNQFITHSLSLYVRIAAMIISTGTGIARPLLGKTMTRFLAIYTMIYGAVFGRVQWIEFIGFHSRWSLRRTVSGFEIHCLVNLLFALNIVFVAVTCFNAMATIIKLDRDQQLHKEQLFRKLITVALLTIIGATALCMLDIWAAHNIETLAPANWVFMYMVDDGFWRILNLVFSMGIMLVLRPHENSSRIAYSVQIPTAGTEDIPTDGAAQEATATEQDKDSSWEDMLAAIGGSGPWIVRKVWKEREEDCGSL